VGLNSLKSLNLTNGYPNKNKNNNNNKNKNNKVKSKPLELRSRVKITFQTAPKKVPSTIFEALSNLAKLFCFSLLHFAAILDKTRWG
jgi:hypothetical protein